jgi:hypothetical protein
MVEGALTVCPLRGQRLRLLFLPLDLCFLGRHFQFAGHEMLGGCGERGREAGRGRFLWRGGGGVWLCLGILAVLGKRQIESTVFSTVVAGLNNQRGGEKLLFQSSRVVFWEYSEDERSFGGLFGLKIRLIIFSGLVSPRKGVFSG